MGEALKQCRKHLGDNATILYDNRIPSSIEKLVKEQGREAGGPWECHNASSFYGWEAERVVVVSNGVNMMELITRARTHLSVILVGTTRKYMRSYYAETKKYFRQAAELGLVEIVQLSLEMQGFCGIQ